MGWFNDIKSRIKGMFNRDKRLPESIKEEVLPHSPYDNWNSKNKHTFTRQDGSILEIEPVLDETGNQRYEQVYNRRIRQFQAVPKFLVFAEELKEIYGPQSFGQEILIDIDSKLLDNSQYSDFIANEILNANRMKKIIYEYGKFAGSIGFNREGGLEKRIDLGIVDTLKSNQLENARKVAADSKKREEEATKRAIEQAENNITDENSYAGRLDL